MIEILGFIVETAFAFGVLVVAFVTTMLLLNRLAPK